MIIVQNVQDYRYVCSVFCFEFLDLLHKKGKKKLHHFPQFRQNSAGFSNCCTIIIHFLSYEILEQNLRNVENSDIRITTFKRNLEHVIHLICLGLFITSYSSSSACGFQYYTVVARACDATLNCPSSFL